jgi:dihydroflavonol-4-reductase
MLDQKCFCMMNLSIFNLMQSISKIAVTGASGHVGNVLCRMLAVKGFRIKALYQSYAKSLEGINAELVQGDVLNKNDLRKLLQDCNIVIHCAAIISINGDPTGVVFKTNTKGSALVLEAAVEMGLEKIIHISSTHAVNELPHHIPFNETRPYKTAKDYAYDHSKAEAEHIMMQSELSRQIDTVVLRLSSVIGPYDFKPSELGKALLDFYHRKIPVLPQGGYNFIDVRDVCNSIINAIKDGRNKEVYLLAGKYFSMKAFADTINKVTGIRTPKRAIPYSTLKAALPVIQWYGRVMRAAPLYTIESIDALKNGHPNMDSSKAAAAFAHQCRPLNDSIRDFYDWHFSNDKNDLKWI